MGIQNNKPVIDAMNELNKRRKATSVSTFDFSTLYTELPHNKVLMVLNSSIDFCFIAIPMGSDPASFFANLFLYFYESKLMNELKKNDLNKARKLCDIFRFIGDSNSINDGGEFESNYSNICPEEL